MERTDAQQTLAHRHQTLRTIRAEKKNKENCKKNDCKNDHMAYNRNNEATEISPQQIHKFFEQKKNRNNKRTWAMRTMNR